MFAARLLALVAPPVLLAGTVTVDRVQHDRDAAAVAHEMADVAAFERCILAIYTPAFAERIGLAGVIRIDALNVPREVVFDVTCIDYDHMYITSSQRLDAALDEMIDDFGGRDVGGAATLEQRLTAAHSRIQAVRQLAAEKTASQEDVDEAFDELLAALDQSLRHVENSVDLSEAPNDALILGQQLHKVADVMASAGPDATAVTEAILAQSPATVAEMIATRAQHGTTIHELNEFAAANDQAGLEGIDGDRPAPEIVLTTLTASSNEVVQDPATLRQLAAVVLDELDYLESLQAAVDGYLTGVIDRSSEVAAAADRHRSNTMRWTLLGLLFTLAAIVFITWSLYAPLRRLTRRADEISAGETHHAPLKPRGPMGTRMLTKAMNDLVGTIDLVDRQASALASGDTDAEVLGERLPGSLGTSLRESVTRLAQVTERLTQSEARASHQAKHDSLTGLPNRGAMMQHLEQHLATGQVAPTVMFIDIDGFKSVNDRHGHGIGDTVLTEIAQRLRKSARPVDLVGRLGGDEFVVIAPALPQPAAIAMGERLIREIEQPYLHGDQWFTLSASIGVVLPDPGVAATQALQQADAAVYLAKSRGRGRVEVYDADLQDTIDRRAQLELALRLAIRNNELDVHYQPVHNLCGGGYWGAEALVRWNRPGIGAVSPAELIEVAERSSLIFELERWVLGQACHRLAQWQVSDPDARLHVAVNISGRHLIDGDLVTDVEAALAASGADPRLLELELTETQLLEDLDRAGSTLAALRERGVTIAVDDFGTGYSSMTYLRRLPVDVVKIDRSFVANATELGYDASVIEALLSIGRTLDLDVVAEGVETEEQLSFIRDRGLDRAQGFLLAKPMPATDVEKLMLHDSAVRPGAHP